MQSPSFFSHAIYPSKRQRNTLLPEAPEKKNWVENAMPISQLVMKTGSSAHRPCNDPYAPHEPAEQT